MGFFTQINQDGQTGPLSEGAAAPRLGPLASLEASYDASVLSASQYGTQVTLQQKEAENNRRIRATGKQGPAPLGHDANTPDLPVVGDLGANWRGVDSYVDAMTASDKRAASTTGSLYAGYDDPSGGRDAEIAKLQQEFPDAGIQTYADMYGQTVKEARDAYQRAQYPRTGLGSVGGFVGSTVASLDPRYNPAQAAAAIATAPLGGEAFGLGLAGRVGLQAGVGGATAGLQDLTGAGDTQERVTGERPNVVADVLQGAVAGAAFQGVGEAAGAALRRVRTGSWFEHAPNDPAPPEPPPAVTPREPVHYADAPATTQAAIDRALAELPGYRTRPMVARAAVDLDRAAGQMADWSGPSPLFIEPPTDTASVLPPEIRPYELPSSAPTGTETVDQIARRIDPQVFGQYDALQQIRQSLRDELGSAADVAERNRVEGGADELQAQIIAMQDQLTQTKGRRQRANLQDRLAGLQSRLEAPAQTRLPAVTEGPFRSASQIRTELQQADERMRDLAPAVSRAYDRAQSKWTSYQGEAAGIRQDVERMLASNETTLPQANPEPSLPSWDEMLQRASAERPADRIPELMQASGQNTRLNENPADTALHVQAEQAKLRADETEALQSRFAKALTDKKSNPLAEPKEGSPASVEPNTLRIGTQTLHLDRDTIEVPTQDGTGSRTVTIRQLLSEAQEDHEILQAVSSCRIG